MDDEKIVRHARVWLTYNRYNQYEIDTIMHTVEMNVWHFKIKIPDGELSLYLNHDDGSVMDFEKKHRVYRSMSDSLAISDAVAAAHKGTRNITNPFAIAALIIVGFDFWSLLSVNMTLLVVQSFLSILIFIAGYFGIERIRTKITKMDAIVQNSENTAFNHYGVFSFVGVGAVQIYIVYIYFGLTTIPTAMLLVLIAFIPAYYVFLTVHFTRHV